MILLVLLAGIAGTTWGLIGAEKANAELAAKNEVLTAEQDKVQARFDTAVKAVETFHTGVSEDALLKNPQFKVLRTKLLNEAAGFYSELEKLLAGQTDAKSKKALAKGYFQIAELTYKIGNLTTALEVQRKSLAIRRELAAAFGADVDTRLDVARGLQPAALLLLYTGDTAGALRNWQEMRDIAAALEAVSPSDAVSQQLAISYLGISQVFDSTGQSSQALAECRKALTIRQKLSKEKPDDNDIQRDLARCYQYLGYLLTTNGTPAEGGGVSPGAGCPAEIG